MVLQPLQQFSLLLKVSVCLFCLVDLFSKISQLLWFVSTDPLLQALQLELSLLDIGLYILKLILAV